MTRVLERWFLRALLWAFSLPADNQCRLHTDCAAADEQAHRCGYQPDHHCRAGCVCGWLR